MMVSVLQLFAVFGADTSHAAADYAAWAKENPDGSWTRETEKAVEGSTLPTAVPSDITSFCRGYVSGSRDERKTFWVGLLSALARRESSFKPTAKHVERFRDIRGNSVISRGLLQISLESANQNLYSCGVGKAEDLFKASVNLKCGVRILETWVKTDGVIASYGDGPVKGGGRYWSTLREANGRLKELMGFTRDLTVCRGH